MAQREIDEVVQITNAAGTEQKVYETPAGQALIIQKLAAVNTDTTAGCNVNVWISPSGGTTPAPGDKDHFAVDAVLTPKETKTFLAAGRKLPAGGTLYVDVDDGSGGNFQSTVNMILSGVLVSQNIPGTGTSA